MSGSRRQFLKDSSIALVVAGAARAAGVQSPPGTQVPPGEQVPPACAPGGLPPAAPPTCGAVAAAATSPFPTPEVIAAAEELALVQLTAAERSQAASSWQANMGGIYERRTGPRQVALPATRAPFSRVNPALPGAYAGPARERFVRGEADPGPLPHDDADIAFAPLTALSRWIERRQLSAQRLTQIYLTRLRTLDAPLRSVITLTAGHARAQARQADAEILAGHYRGALHGIPWGAKDLLDTAGIATTYGAELFRDRIPARDAAVVERLNRAGAVLVAKLSMGALALNDVWFGGQTMNPWLPQEGSSGSSAGPAAATAAGLVAFAIGSETSGSIVSPSMRCGVTGLRPTFGRVARTGAMTLCWSLDKLGPMARRVEDVMLVLQAISGPDPGDPSSVASHLDFAAREGVQGLRLGYFPSWMQQPPATAVDRAALEAARRVGMQPLPVSIPDWPYDCLNLILFAEAAAAFEPITLDHSVDRMRMQVPDAWPNIFRQSRFLSAVDFVQADRLRRSVAEQMAQLFTQVDVLLVPSLRDEMLTITNFTGHPSLTLRAGFVEVHQARGDWTTDPAHPLPSFSPPRRVPYGITLIGRLFDEGTLGRAALALERTLGVADERPPGF